MAANRTQKGSNARSDSSGPSRRGLRKRGIQILVACLAVASLAGYVAARSTQAASTGSTSASRTLHMAFSYDQGSLDPDVFYYDQGLLITTSCYEGLVRYKDNSIAIEPWLARSYSISHDAKTYTFHLRPNVRFADGSKLTSKVIKFDIARRAGVNAGPAYMVGNVVSVGTPNALTVVIHLNHPVSPFMHYLASPYGPKAVSESAIKAHATKKDKWATKWLADHCAGTGPYTLSHAVVNQNYTLAANHLYWGHKPYYTTVQIHQIPSFTTQQLELRSHELDMMLVGVPPQQLSSFKQQGFQVKTLPSSGTTTLWLDPHHNPFSNSKARLAASFALNRPQLLSEVFGNTATINNSYTLPGVLPKKYGGVYTTKYNPTKAKTIVKSLPASARNIKLDYDNSNVINPQLAGLIGQQLDAVGFHVTTRQIEESVEFTWHSAPDSKRPDMFIDLGNPDDADPSSYPVLDWFSSPGAVSFFPPLSPAADQLIRKGEAQKSIKKAYTFYGKALNMYGKLHAEIPLASMRMVVTARKGITGIAGQRQGGNVALLDLAALRGN